MEATKDITSNKHHNNPASVEAFERAKPHASRTREVIKDFIWAHRGVTSEDVQAHLRKMLPHADNWPPNAFSRRITEFLADKQIDRLPALRNGRQVLVRFKKQMALLEVA